MTSSSAIHVSAGDSPIAILHDELRLTLCLRARLSARAAIGSQDEAGCSKEHAA